MNTNGTVRLNMEDVTNKVNIISLEPYKERTRNSSLEGECNIQNSKKQRKAGRRPNQNGLCMNEIPKIPSRINPTIPVNQSKN